MIRRALVPPPAAVGRAIRTVACLWIVCLCTACAVPGDGSVAQPAGPPDPSTGPEVRWGERVDRSESHLRILIHRDAIADRLPRGGHPREYERQLALEFAGSRGLTPLFISLDRRADLLPALVAGYGDVVVGSVTVTGDRARQVAFSLPIGSAREQLITRADDVSLTTEADLTGRRLAVRESSSFRATAATLVARNERLSLQVVPEEIDAEEVLYRVATGEYDVAIADSHLVEAVLTYQPELRVAFDVSPERPHAWAVRPGDSELLGDINAFLEEVLPGRTPQRATDDLSEIKKRKALRVLTRNSAATYFVYRGQLLGFEFELVERFAKSQGLYLELVVPPTRSALIPWLRAGRGDLIAASLVATKEREKQGVAFSSPYKFTQEVVVARADEDAVQSIEDLSGRTIVVRRSSSYWETALELQAEIPDVTLVPAPEDLETEEIIERVEVGEYDLTIADSHILDIELTWRKDVRSAVPLTEKRGHRWVVRRENTALLAAVDQFLASETRSRGIAKTLARYFQNPWRTKRYVSRRASKSGELSPFDALVRKHAGDTGLDWRLIVSQMYQESRFNPDAESPAGAKGLMQFMSATAREYGLADRTNPEQSIRAGIRYLSDLRDSEYGDLPANERIWFALAAYNAGPGHVLDARRLAQELELDPDRWFGNVEEAILLLSRRQYYSQARYGYCRGSEPSAYVRDIRSRYEAYLRSTASR